MADHEAFDAITAKVRKAIDDKCAAGPDEEIAFEIDDLENMFSLLGEYIV